MSEHRATIDWKLTSESFAFADYNREHRWTFPGGTEFEAAAAPDYLGKPECVDPEEAFVAALSSCHMLTFLAIASKKRFQVSTYHDEPVGYLEKNEDGKLVVARVILRPVAAFEGERQPNAADLDRLHQRAHQECFLANSVKTDITVETP